VLAELTAEESTVVAREDSQRLVQGFGGRGGSASGQRAL
jgi:hypothetical protein